MNRFEGKAVLVTGANGGIGLASAIRMAREGARTVLVARDTAKLSTAEQEVRRAGSPDVLVAACDVADPDAVESVVARALERFGRLDAVVNNAGLLTIGKLVDADPDDWRRVFEVDVLGAVHFGRQALLHLGEGGSIVNVSSIQAMMTSVGIGAYAAAKAALVSLTRTMAIEGRERRLRANVVLPGAIDTPFLQQNPNVRSGAETFEEHELGTPEDVAGAVAFLASDDARFVQGAALVVDGGRTCHL